MSNFNNDILFVTKRLGNPSDPYVSLVETKVISNGMIVLKEVPDDFSGITITGASKTWVEVKNKNTTLTTGQFYSDYKNGYLYFSSADNNLSVTINYMGTGGLYVADTRVVSLDSSGNITQTLQDWINTAQAPVNNFTSTIGAYDNTKSYLINNIVNWNGAFYVCVQNTTGNSPTLNTNNAYWNYWMGVNTQLSTLRNEVTINNAVSSVSVGISAYNSNNDLLFVHKNSTYLQQGTDYNISGGTITPINTTWDGTSAPLVFDFLVLKNTISTVPTGDGSLLQAGSVGNAQLAPDAKIGSLPGLLTVAKDSAVNAINENVNKINVLSGLVPQPTSTLSNYAYASYLAWLNDQETRQWEYGLSVKGRKFGASGSAQTITGTITAGSSTLTLASAIDFANGQGIAINHAGATCTLTTPSAPTVTPTGTAGATTYQYQVVALDSNGGCTTASTATSIANGNATLSVSNYNALSWTAVTNAKAYAIYGRVNGSMSLLGIVSGTTWNDIGSGAITAPTTLPSTPPTTALADTLVTTISSGAGTTTLTLSSSATTSATSQTIMHDDSVAIQNAINYASANGWSVVRFPWGTYRIFTGLTVGSDLTLVGVGRRDSMIDPHGFVTGITINGSSNRVAIRDLFVNSTDKNASYGIVVASNSHNCRFINVEIMGFLTSGLNVQDNCWDQYFEDILISGCLGDGFQAGAAFNDCLFNHVQSNYNNGNGFTFLGSTPALATSFIQCHAEGNGGSGVYLYGTGAGALDFIGCYVERNGDAGYKLGYTTGSQSNSIDAINIIGGNIYGNLNWAIDAYIVKNVTVNGTRIAGGQDTGGANAQGAIKLSGSMLPAGQTTQATLINVPITSDYATLINAPWLANVINGNQVTNPQPTKTITSGYNITFNDYVILGNAASGALSCTLPDAGQSKGRTFVIKKIDASANAFNVLTTSSQTIDGATSKGLTTQYQSVRVTSDGTQWWIS